MDVTSILGEYTEHLKEEESLFQMKINPHLSLLSQHTHKPTHFSLIGILSGFCVCVGEQQKTSDDGWQSPGSSLLLSPFAANKWFLLETTTHNVNLALVLFSVSEDGSIYWSINSVWTFCKSQWDSVHNNLRREKLSSQDCFNELILIHNNVNNMNLLWKKEPLHTPSMLAASFGFVVGVVHFSPDGCYTPLRCGALHQCLQCSCLMIHRSTASC